MTKAAEPAARRRSRARLLAPVLVFLAAAAVFSPARNHEFIDFDDNVYVRDNAVVARGLTADGFRWAFTTFEAANWHPLTWISHMLDVQILGPDPGGQHLTSVLIHAANAALLCALLHAMTGALWRSAAAAALFALHPLRVESVAWLSERKDVLSGLLFMLALLAYLRWARRPRAARYAAVAAACALGLMSKPMLVTLPFVLLLLDFWPLDRLRLPAAARSAGRGAAGIPFRRLLLEKAPLLALAAASGVMTVLAQQANEAIRQQRYSLAVRLGNAVHSYAAYLGATFWPSGLMIFYPHPGRSLPPGQLAAAGLLLLALTVLAVLGARARPWLATGWLWFLGMLVPVIGLVHAGAQGRADRYTYLPLIGIVVAVAWSVPGLTPPRRRVPALVFAMAMVCALAAFLTSNQLGTMRDSETLFRHMLSVDPDNDLALSKLGSLLTGQGRIEEGSALLSRAYRRNPLHLARLHLFMAGQLERQGKPDEALLEYTKVLEFDPLNAEGARAVARLKPPAGTAAIPPTTAGGPPGDQEATSWFNQGNTLAAVGHYEQAVDYYRRAVALKPGFADAWNNLGTCLGKLGRHVEAAAAFERAVAAAPDNKQARDNLARARRASRR